MNTEWDVGGVTFDRNAVQQENAEHARLEERFLAFIRTYRRDNAFIYRDQLKQNFNLGQNLLDVRIEDLTTFDEQLANNLVHNPYEYLRHFEKAAKEALEKSILRDTEETLQPIQVLINSAQNPVPIRELASTHMSKLVRVPGIVISASRTQAKASLVMIQCRSCGNQKLITVRPGFSAVELPRACDANLNEPGGGKKCPPNPFQLQPERCTFVDQQTLKLQENPENVPTGEMPRHMLLSVDRNLVGRSVPGSRVTAVGIYTIYKGAAKQLGSAAIRHTYLQVLGLTVDSDGGRINDDFTASEVLEFQEFARHSNCYESIVHNIAPSIWGHDDIKRALACQLFGGCRKELADGMKLRGDINILLLGDPGTAKSQLLKFIEKVAPIAVYTSGKGSSAAGLTASVIRDHSSREFYLEGGAMVLADGGVVCIDEFDKMRVQDRVAIHEAMEQQTISIAKAGITTILNSRTAVLAAANPQFTVYDETRSTADNLSEFRSTILSRFDCIFLVRDARNMARDLAIARHVMNVHMKAAVQSDDDSSSFPLQKLKRYIGYCKSKCEPRLSKDAAEILSNKYVAMRAQHRQRELSGSNSIPITVRQLEAIVRLAESLAKMRLVPLATEEHVEEAIRIFTVSTVDAINSGNVQLEQMNDTVRAEVDNAENLIKRRLAVGSRISEKKLIESISAQYDLSDKVVRKAIQVMVQREELEYRSKAMTVLRKR